MMAALLYVMANCKEFSAMITEISKVNQHALKNESSESLQNFVISLIGSMPINMVDFRLNS